jgi:zinc transport system ATP-binding protein
MRGPTVTFEGVGLRLSGNEILRNVNLSIEAGTIHCLIGPNGGGKTSLIRCLLGQMPHTGKISIAWSESAQPSEKIIGYVPQSLDFDKTLPVSVMDFMAIICQRYRPAFMGMSRYHRKIVNGVLDRFGLQGKQKSKLGSLSGGERQRVLFAQALIPEPSLLVLDEPMTSMDEVGMEIFVKVIREAASRGTTVIWIAHDLAQVRAIAGAVSCVNRTLLFSGPTAEMLADHQAEILFGQMESLA